MDNNFENTFGLKISNGELTAIELTYSKKGIKVNYFSHVDLAPGVVENDYLIMDAEAFKEAVRKLLSKSGKNEITSKNVIISIPERKVFSHYLDIPTENIRDLSFIRQAANDFIPIELDEATTDYRIIEGASTEKMKKVHFVAVQENFAESIIEALKELGLNVVAIDVSNNTLIRACENEFNHNKDDFMIVDIEKEGALITVVTKSGMASSIHSKVTKEFKDVLKKTNELVKSMRNEMELDIKTIYILGPKSSASGLKEAFEKTFESAKIVEELEYIKIEKERSADHARVIGLALRACLPSGMHPDIDLLPWKKKREVESERITPTIKKIIATTTLVIGGLFIFAGIFTAESRLALDFINETGKMIFQKANNPELNSIALQTQQESQLERQISTILNNAIPAGAIMEAMNELPTADIRLLSVTYALPPADGDPIIQLYARSKTRESTKAFVVSLENNLYFSEVNSPLSNLTGKGDRTIEINLTVDTQSIIEDFGGFFAPEETPALTTSQLETVAPIDPPVNTETTTTTEIAAPTEVPATEALPEDIKEPETESPFDLSL